MNRKLVEKWVRALESGRWKQGKKALYSDDGEFCCLGVGACIVRKKHGVYFSREKRLTDTLGSVANSLGVDRDIQCLLITMNDIENRSFKEIAAWIRTNILKERTEKNVNV